MPRMVARRRGPYQDLSTILSGQHGDGVGDLKGQLPAASPHVAALARIAFGSSQIFASPTADNGLMTCRTTPPSTRFSAASSDFDALIAAAHALGPQGHCRSSALAHLRQHDWFKAEPPRHNAPTPSRLVCLGCPLPDARPTNWQTAHFGGPALGV